MPEEPVLSDDHGQPAATNEALTRRRRLLALGLVLSVSFLHFIATAFYSLFSGTYPDPASQSIRLISALIAEVTSLLLLWFVLSEQKRTWKDIGWNAEWADLFRGVGLAVVASLVGRGAVICFQVPYLSYTGRYLQPRPVHSIIGGGVAFLPIVFVLINPFFEELIVRGYMMSEVVGLGGSQTLAIFASVFVQMSYHVYQGLLHCIALTVAFIVFSIYFSRTRNIAPVVMAHFCSDAQALIRHSF
jgi:membrane protease YdiL (CAAX protease family)